MELNSRFAIHTLDLDGNEALLTNYAANKRELTAINNNKAHRTSLPSPGPLCIFCNSLGFVGVAIAFKEISLRNIFSAGFWKQLVGDGTMVSGFSANLLAFVCTQAHLRDHRFMTIRF
jgi:hypothetical protein